VTGQPSWSDTTPSHPRQLSPPGLIVASLSFHSQTARETHKNEAAKFNKDRLLRREAPTSSPLSFYMQEASYEAFWPLLPLAAFTILFAFRLAIRFVHKIW